MSMFTGHYDRAARQCTWDDREVFPTVTPQWPWEIENAAILVRNIQPHVVVEIGTQNGGSLRYWLQAAPPDARVIVIDPNPLIDDIHDERIELCRTLSNDPATIAHVRDAGIDFLFIDGDHLYNGARADFDTYGPLVRPGGVIMLHDIATFGRGDCEVHRLWREIQAAGYVTQELLAFHYYAFGGIGVVYR